MEARIGKFINQSQGGENTISHFTQMMHDEVDSIRKQGEDMQMLMKERVIAIEH